jgi:hypothetical protein
MRIAEPAALREDELWVRGSLASQVPPPRRGRLAIRPIPPTKKSIMLRCQAGRPVRLWALARSALSLVSARMPQNPSQHDQGWRPCNHRASFYFVAEIRPRPGLPMVLLRLIEPRAAIETAPM